MVDKGNADKYRRSMSGMRVQNAETWGRRTAEERFGPLKFRDGAPGPADKHAPQAPEDKQAPGYSNIHREDWVRGFGKGGVESAEGKPNFQSGHKGKK